MRLPATLTSLRHRNARLFFAGLAVSNIGTWIQMTAMALLVYRLTGQATAIGFTLALQFLPMLLLGVWAGAVADRHDRLRLTLLLQASLAAQAVLLGVLDLAGLVTLPVVYVLSFFLGVLNAFDNPARRGFVTELVEPHEITNVISLSTAVMTGSRIFGPAIAALLVGPLGTGWLFVLNGVTFSAIILALLAIDRSRLAERPLAPRGGQPVRDALRFVSGQPMLRATFVVFTVVSTFGFNFSVALPKLADVRWGDDAWFGWLLAATGVGSFLGALLTASRPVVTVPWFVGSGVVMGTSAVLLAWAPVGGVALALAVPLGLGGAGVITGMNAIIQQECPAEMRSRMLALTAVAFLGSTPIGGPITGRVGDLVSAEWALAYGGVVTLAAMAVLVVLPAARSEVSARPETMEVTAS